MATQQGELAVRNVKMVDEEVEAKLLILREGILEQQCKQLLGVNRNLSVELVSIRSFITLVQMLFRVLHRMP